MKVEMMKTSERHRNQIPVAVSMILSELDRAIEKHPKYPMDLIHASAIVSEEAGELTRACLQYVYEPDGIPYENLQRMALRDECIQVGCTAIRMLIHLQEDGMLMYHKSTQEVIEEEKQKQEGSIWKRIYHAIRAAI